jgi:ribose transport system ATP-binding protein
VSAAAGGGPALRMRGIVKRFGPSVALAGVDLDLAYHEVHGLIGMNGSGKSTLIKILTGLYPPDAGEAELWGRPLGFPVHNPRRQGIAVVHQQLGLVESMSIQESFGSGIGYSARAGYVSWRRERAEWAAYCRRLDVDLDAQAKIGDISASERTIVALIRSLRELERGGGHLLILDEPTASFSPPEVRRLRAIVREIADAGGCVLFVSHHLQELLDFCDRITVLRDGRDVATVDGSEATADGLVQLMLGDELAELSATAGRRVRPDDATASDLAPVLSLDRVSTDRLRDLSFDVRPQEIVGVTGLAGMGQEEVAPLVCGMAAPASGSISLMGEPVATRVRGNLGRGLAVVPGDRAREGLWLEGNGRENVSLPVLRRFFSRGLMRHRAERSYARERMTSFDVRPRDGELPVRSLSGGNQQKLVFAKAMASSPRLLLLHEPTVGVDVHARTEIYRLIHRTARDTAVLVIGTDYDELAQLCHRVIVLRSGRVAGELDGAEVTERAITTLCNATTTAPPASEDVL